MNRLGNRAVCAVLSCEPERYPLWWRKKHNYRSNSEYNPIGKKGSFCSDNVTPVILRDVTQIANWNGTHREPDSQLEEVNLSRLETENRGTVLILESKHMPNTNLRNSKGLIVTRAM